ncbi:MAG: LysE family transporter [Paludibacteraceae bacterium]|nr:LysE family transporter [Paludibacteraceae bacterium]MBQ1851885.1 LysE family transporter [Paludibacteraceae bacterium]MBQ2065702.1 LysE family transporter [Paludibacteraceae bacterium]
MLLSTITQGFIIGLCTSAPVGPIAILCIQRTLQNGRKTGFISGLGAASSDFVYALIALFGLSFVMDFIQQHEFLIQLIGAIVIMAFGIFIFFQNPTKGLRKRQSTSSTTYFQEYLTSFALTITNPLMIFLFLGLYARMEFLVEPAGWWEVVLGMLAVLAGSTAWWFTITLIASTFHNKFNIRGLWILNKITGTLIFVIALISLILTLTGNSLTASI